MAEKQNSKNNKKYLKLEDDLLALTYNNYSLFEVLFLAKIISLSNSSEGCVASNEWFQWWFKTSISSIQRALRKFKKDGIVTIRENKYQLKSTVRHIYVNFDILRDIEKEGKNNKKIALETDSKSTEHIVKMTPPQDQKIEEGHIQFDTPPHSQKDTSSISNIESQIDQTTYSKRPKQVSKRIGIEVDLVDKVENNYLDEVKTSSLKAPNGAKNNNKNKQLLEEYDMASKSGKLELMQEFWITLNPIRKYQYINSYGNAALYQAYSEIHKEENQPNYYSDNAVLTFFETDMQWLETNCMDWLIEYNKRKELQEYNEKLERIKAEKEAVEKYGKNMEWMAYT